MGSVKKRSFPFWDFNCYNIAPTKWGWQPAFHGRYTEKCGLQNQRNTNDWIREIQNCTNQIRLAASWPIKFSHNRSELHKFANWNMTKYIVHCRQWHVKSLCSKKLSTKIWQSSAGMYIIHDQMSMFQKKWKLKNDEVHYKRLNVFAPILSEVVI